MRDLMLGTAMITEINASYGHKTTDYGEPGDALAEHQIGGDE